MNIAGDKVNVPAGATDASMTPYHVARSKLFVRERSGKSLIHLDTAEIEANIEHTRFPVPGEEQHEPTDDFPGLVRAADLIGQLADINYLRKTAALFNEFRETGMSKKLKYESAEDLRANYPDFFWKMVGPYIGDALRYLRVTQEGQNGFLISTQTYSRWSIEANSPGEIGGAAIAEQSSLSGAPAFAQTNVATCLAAPGFNRDAESLQDWPMVWFPILGENRLGQFRMVMNAAPAIRDAEICPIIPHPSRDLRRAEKLLIEYKPEPRGHRPRRKTGGWGFEPHALTIAPCTKRA
jgi:hypothetical protein